MRITDRAVRRHHVERLKKARKHYWGYPNKWAARKDGPPVTPAEMDGRQLGKVVQYPQACSCAGCCNVRRAPNMNGGELTRSERHQLFDLKEWHENTSD